MSSLQSQLNKLQAAQAAQAAQASGSGFPVGPSTGTPAGSSGGFTFPLPKSAASPPGTWSPDDGVDISAPGDAPEFAVCSGTIVLHGIGGFGPWAPVLHCDSPVGGYDYVYYGHAGPLNQQPVGAHVSAGEMISSVGPGIVGISTGPHLEIGFADSSGSPIGPGSAGDDDVAAAVFVYTRALPGLRGGCAGRVIRTGREPLGSPQRPLSSAGRALPW